MLQKIHINNKRPNGTANKWI